MLPSDFTQNVQVSKFLFTLLVLHSFCYFYVYGYIGKSAYNVELFVNKSYGANS